MDYGASGETQEEAATVRTRVNHARDSKKVEGKVSSLASVNLNLSCAVTTCVT